MAEKKAAYLAVQKVEHSAVASAASRAERKAMRKAVSSVVPLVHR